MSTPSFDVVVAGAGPAGIASAVALVREGLSPGRVLVLDRAHFPRPKPCGGGLTGRALDALASLGLALRVPSEPCGAGRLVFGHRREDVPMPRPVHVVRREDFDADLVAQARACGLVVAEGEALEDYAADAGGVMLRTSRRALRARVLVAADGVGSFVRKRLLGGSSAAPLRLCRLELPDPGVPRGRMLYDFSAMGQGLRGYVWIFPVPGGRINVGAMHDAAADATLGGRALDGLLRASLARFGVDLPGPARGWPAWPYDPALPIAAPRVLLAGDAAGIDGLTGEGIAVGLEHGPLVAQAVRTAFDTGDFAFAGYGRAVRRAPVGRELAMDGLLARLLYGAAAPEDVLGLVFDDPGVRALYAARVSGTVELAHHKLPLLGAFARHLWLGAGRAARLRAAAVSPSDPGRLPAWSEPSRQRSRRPEAGSMR